jgi:DMSO/TMAO reductase YedYZ molybdopterin-dependent catalytic subunit
MPTHPTETPEYWERLARHERAFAAEKRRTRHGTVESIKIHESNAAEYEAQANKLRKVRG